MMSIAFRCPPRSPQRERKSVATRISGCKDMSCDLHPVADRSVFRDTVSQVRCLTSAVALFITYF